MSNVKSNSDALGLVRDDDLRQAIDNLDQMCIGLSDLEAVPVLNDELAIQQELHHFGKITRMVADLLSDLLFHFREESHR